MEFGAFLSGGIDSSIIVGIMAQLIPNKVNSFSVVFDEEEFSEARYSQMIAEKYKTNHHEIKLKVGDFFDMLPDALQAMDHPSGDGPNTYLISKKTREKGVKMALSGLGGDELFAGYDLFKYCANISQNRWITSFPLFIRKMAASLYSNISSSSNSAKVRDVLVQDYFDLEYIYPTMRTVLTDDLVSDLTLSKLLVKNAVFQKGQEHISHGSYAFGLPYLSKVSVLEMQTYMSNVLLRDSDQMSMAHALEIRLPFLDHEFINLILSIEDKLKYPITPKKLLVEAFDDILPYELVNRKKMGFTFPWKEWMRNELKEFCQSHIDSLSVRHSFSEVAVQKLWRRFMKGDPQITWSRLWHLIVLENWLQQHSIEA